MNRLKLYNQFLNEASVRDLIVSHENWKKLEDEYIKLFESEE